ncbi:nitroreductase family protein [Nonomuraea rubra]
MSNRGPASQALGLTADEVLTTTRAVRRRLDLTRPVPRELIQEAVKVATQAPTGRNQRQWDFIFIDDPATKAKAKAKAAEIWRAGLMAGAPNEHDPAPLPTRMT